jgi:hypothetical protein
LYELGELLRRRRDQLRIELRLTEFQRGNVVLFGIGALGAHRDTA